MVLGREPVRIVIHDTEHRITFPWRLIPIHRYRQEQDKEGEEEPERRVVDAIVPHDAHLRSQPLETPCISYVLFDVRFHREISGVA